MRLGGGGKGGCVVKRLKSYGAVDGALGWLCNAEEEGGVQE